MVGLTRLGLHAQRCEQVMPRGCVSFSR